MKDDQRALDYTHYWVMRLCHGWCTTMQDRAGHVDKMAESQEIAFLSPNDPHTNLKCQLYSFYYGICILWGSFEDPQMDPQMNHKCSEGSFYYDFRITFECACLFLYDPQTILKCVWATFCNDFQRFWGTETWDLYNTKGLSLSECSPHPVPTCQEL